MDGALAHILPVVGTVLYVARAAPATVALARGRGLDPDAALSSGCCS